MHHPTRTILRGLLWTSMLCACAGAAWAAPDAAAPAANSAAATNQAASSLPAPTSTVVDAHPVSADVGVTAKQDLAANQDLNNWILYGRTYTNQRFSPLNEITADNVSKLTPVAIIQTGVVGSFENSPIVVNGIMYISTPYDHVFAYDAATGKELWSYKPDLGYTQLCCGPESRGVAVSDGKLYLGLLDGELTALDAKTGKVEWQTQVGDPRGAFSVTMAPQVYDGMVIVGTSGAEYPTRDFVAAYDSKTGKEIWRFYTVASPGEPGGSTWSGDSWKTGGGSMWNTPAIDPTRGLVIFGVGNPNPDNYGDDRKGDNAYTDSIVALHVKTGKLAWWYQEVPHDVWDYDADAPVVLLNVKDASGNMVAAAAEAGKEGNVFIVNRDNGHLIRKSAAFVEQSKTMWTKPPLNGYVNIYPGAQGGNEWSPEAYSPDTHLFYVDGTNESWEYSGDKPEMTVVGHLRLGGVLQPITPQGPIELGEPGAGDHKAHTDGAIVPTGDLSAVDPDTGKIVWQYKSGEPMLGGVLTTGGNLVFAGEMNGDFDAFNAKTGQKLWDMNLGSGVNAPAITYRVNGQQYIAVAAGGNAANGNPVLMKKLGLNYGDAVAILALK
ncbi:MAG TPA: PQQ-binding-like beta-propeller repeat protein [Acetobacteraceae bacterium]|jgi:alcohol dehydrogenase (cytochrome c)|nr:PQQ-binding-like beta-propeller repeat protein [Acetobacteraceae bacterium]